MMLSVMVFGPGSPPHAWGRPPHLALERLDVRFTPTCVGTACAGARTQNPTPVHPHMRGDGEPAALFDDSDAGSPPHAWGRLHMCTGGGGYYSVHPHMRGDGIFYSDPTSASTGSPPHAWGRPGIGYSCAGWYRFTPTCVGTAARCQPQDATEPVHPHMRGDGFCNYVLGEGLSGSPPHAWGRRVARVPRYPLTRFTPTCVGTAAA